MSTQAQTTSAGSARSMTRWELRWAKWKPTAPIYFLVLPTVAMLIIFFYFPAVKGFITSFQYVDVRITQWVGFENYERLFADRRIAAAFGNLAFLTVFNIIVVTTVPLAVAAMIFHLRSTRMQYWWRVIFVVPIIVPTVATIVVWRWMYGTDGGVNILLGLVGLGDLGRGWLGNRDSVMWALAFTNFPWAAGINFLIYYAGLQEISQEVLEAAVADGASGLRRFWLIELPLVRPQMRLLVLLTIIFWLRSFELPLIMTNGGPGYASMVPGLRMYQSITRDFDLGFGSAVGTILFVIILVVTIFQLRLTRSRDDVF